MIISARPLVLLLILFTLQDIKGVEGSNGLCVYTVYDDGGGPGDHQDVSSCCSSGNCVFGSLSDALGAATSNVLINLTTNIDLTSNITIDHVAGIIIDGVNSPTVHCANTGGVHFTSCSNVTIRGIIWEECGFNGGNTTTTYISPAVQFYNSSNITIEECSFHNSTGQVVVLSMVAGVWITSCQFSHNNQYGDHGAAIHYSCGTENCNQLSLVVDNCSFTLNGPAESVIYINGSTSEVYENVSVQNSVFLNNEGVSINTSHVHLHLGGNVLFQQNTANNGGVMSVTSSTIEVDSNSIVYFNNNSANINGGAVYLHNSNINFGINSFTQFKGNTANTNGGSIYSESGSLITFSDNSTTTFTSNNASQYGGALYLHYSVISPINSAIRFVNNSATQQGGAVYLYYSDIAINKNCSVVFNNNSAQYYGGAVYLYYYSDIAINKNCSVVFNNNSAQYGGAVYLYYYSDISANNSIITFTRNTATYRYGYGGAIYVKPYFRVDITFNNSVITFDSNTAYYSGAVYGYRTIISFSGHSVVTFNNNSARYYGGAVLLERNSQISFSDTSVVTFNNNRVRYYGGAAVHLTYYSEMSISDTAVVTFNNNSNMYRDGGAIYAYSSSHISFTATSKVTFTNNFADDDGGAIFAYQYCHISFSDTSVVTFNNNTARDYGGAIYAYYNSHISFSNVSMVTFNNNSARYYDGGAIYIRHSTTISFNDTSVVTFNGNRARSGGAIYAASAYSNITFNDTSVITFLNNTATQYGGVVYTHDHVKIFFDEHTSVTFHTNYATQGSALYSTHYCSLWLQGNSMVVFTENSAGAVVYISDSNIYFQSNTSVQFVNSNSGPQQVVNCTGNSLVLLVGNIANFHTNTTTGGEIFIAQQQCRIIHPKGIDECLSNNGGCSQICRNTVDSFNCACFTGYVLAPDQRTCNDIDECGVSNGGCQQTCTNTDGSYFCSCSTGYSLNSDQQACDDINECVVGHPCTGDCANSIGSFQCLCAGDQTYDNTTNRCISPDYCTSDPCQHLCVSGSTSYQCYCQSGFNISSDGRNCIDINECQSNNGGCHQVCVNQPGSYQCSCISGYTLNGDGHNCSRVQCADPPSIDGLMFACSPPHHVGDTCNVSCAQQGDAYLPGNDTIHCLITGYWEAASAACFIPIPNDPPSGLMLSTSSILENIPVGTAIGTFIVTDHNIDQTHTFTLVDSAGGLFRISSTNLLVNGRLNYEAFRLYTIQVTVTDNGVPQLSTTFSLNISVLNENEPPSNATISNNEIAENVAVNTVVGLLSATDPDEGQNVSFTLLTTGGGKFALNSYSQLITTSGLNYERQNQFMLAIQVSDSASPSLSTISTITITVQDHNDAPTSITPSHLRVAENSLIGQTLTALTIEDEDTSGTYSVSLTPSYGLEVNNLQLIVADPSMLDYEAYPSHSVTVSMALTDGDFTLTQQLSIHLADINEAPTGISLSSYSVHEHIPVGSVIGSLYATDQDFNDTHTFALEEGLQNNLVRIDGASLLVNNDINYETLTSFSIMVQVSDKGALNYTQRLTIIVINKNEAPNSFSFVPYTMHTCSPSRANTACVLENTQPPLSIGQLFATDPDGDQVTYTFTNFTELASYFILNDTSDPPQLMLYRNTFNYESSSYGNEITIGIEVADVFGLSSRHIITVEILDVNDPPTTIMLSNTVISERAVVGQIIGILQGIDEDEDQLTYRLGYSPNGLFRIDGNHLVVAQTLDHENAMNVHNISIICSDGMAESGQVWFIIEISDANEPPINITLDGNAIPENSPSYTNIGVVTAHDVDASEILMYQLDDDARGRFRLVQEGNGRVLQSLMSFDYEMQNTYSITVRVTDSAGHFKLQAFAVQITDVDEPPEYTVLHFNPVHEGLSNITVGVFTAIDPERRPLTFELNDTTNTFKVNQVANNTVTLHLLSPLNFEETASQYLAVTVTDRTTTPVTQIIMIMVLDQNEPPTDIVLNSQSVDENVLRGTNVSTIAANDPDFTESFTCTLIDNSNGMFIVTDLSLIVHGNLNHEQQPLHTITVECADKGELTYTKAFNITVLDVNDPPTDIEPNTGFIIAENVPPGTRLAVLTTTDEDLADSFEYLLLNHTDKFTIEGNVTSTLVPLNFEEQSHYQVDIQSTDLAGASIIISTTITVVDSNDAPDHIFFSTATLVPENVSINTTFGRLVVHDEDVNDNHTFATVGRSQHFRIDQYGIVYTTKLFDFELSSEIVLDVVAIDNGNLKHIQSIVVQVTDVNEAPYDIHLSDYDVAENQPAGITVATITVEDQDHNETFSCQLTQPPPFYFEVIQNGVHIALVTTNSTIDYEATPTFLVALTCFDHGGLEHSKNISITVIDDNDPPTAIIFGNAQYPTPMDDRQLLTTPVVQLSEIAYVGQIVTDIMIVDEDINDMHTCILTNSSHPNAFCMASSGLALQTNSSLKFEEINMVYLQINCSDDSEMITTDLRVVILDVNDPIFNISLIPNVVSENSPSGTPVGVFNFTDSDTTTSVYILTLSSTSAPFVITRNSSHWYLSVSRQNALNYEIFPSFTLTILVQEINPGANFSHVQVVKVFLEDVNESPAYLTFHGGYNYIVVPSRTHPGIVIESFVVSDEDLNDVHSFEMLGGTVEDYFEISGENLVLSKQLAPGRYDLLLDVIATDLGNLTTIRHFVISVVDDSTCNRTSNPCHENAICFVQHPGQVSCVCELGYLGDGYLCVDINYCESNPCHPNNTIGDCIDEEGGIDSYTCDCIAGYDPPNCYTEIDECAPMPCDPVGSSGCVDLLGDFNCTCQRGYTGRRCEVFIDNCADNPCLNNGSCTDNLDGFTCICMAPYWGVSCEKSDTVCEADKSCPHSGECDTQTNTCQCTKPYIENCQYCVDGCVMDSVTGGCVDYDECDNDPHPCGRNSNLTCVNFKNRPCSYCCLDDSGSVQFCGPKESDDHSNDHDQSHQDSQHSEPTSTTSTVAIVAGLFSGILIVLLIIIGVVFVRYCYVKRFRVSNITTENQVKASHTCHSFANQTYIEPKANSQKDDVYVNTFPCSDNKISAVTITSKLDDNVEEEDEIYTYI